MQIMKRLLDTHAKSGIGSATIVGLLIVSIVLVSALWAMTREWGKPLLDLHAFRQTQTAISAYYMAEDSGMFFDYITPVLGKPWSIPMELPIYQWIVARWHNFSGMGLDQSGKAISIAFWFACIWPIWRILGSLRQTTAQRCICLALVYSAPLYLYWGRAFMIESTGLFLSLGMVACVYSAFQNRSWRWLSVGLAFGVGAALCKVTTWAVSVGVAELLVLFATGTLPKRNDFRWIGLTSAALVILLVPAKLWLAHGDAIKSENSFAREIILSTLPDQKSWNYGTWEQKLNLQTWQHIWHHITDQILVPLPFIGPFLIPIILVLGALASPKRIPIILIFIVGFASGPLIFTNLYLEHNYYWCANGIWLLIAAGVALGGIHEYKPETQWPRITAVAFTVIITFSGFKLWSVNYLPVLKSLPTPNQLADAWTKPVQNIVPPGRTLMILGYEWNSFALYYAQRKGIAYPQCGGIKFPSPQLTESLTKLGSGEKLGAVVIAESLLTTENQADFVKILQQLGISGTGIRTSFGVLFPADDLQPVY